MTASITHLASGQPSAGSARAPAGASVLRDQLLFALICLLIGLACATFCGLAPITISIATVFLFAGPHNWIELRYFLSRLPARFGTLKVYFATGMMGALILAVSFPLMAYLGKAQLITIPTWIAAYQIGNVALVAWVCSLIMIRHGSALSIPRFIVMLGVALSLIALIWKSPGYFGMSLVYLHPFVALLMLDLELRRSKPHLVAPFRMSAGLIPALIGILYWQLAGTPSIEQSDPLVAQICRHAGAQWITGVSVQFLVATHTFLEILHYVVWLLAIPLMAAGWSKWRPRSLPITVVSSTAKKLVSAALAFSTFAVAVLWFCFGTDFNAAREWYFLLAMIHVFAEIPFLIRFF